MALFEHWTDVLVVVKSLEKVLFILGVIVRTVVMRLKHQWSIVIVIITIFLRLIQYNLLILFRHRRFLLFSLLIRLVYGPPSFQILSGFFLRDQYLFGEIYAELDKCLNEI